MNPETGTGHKKTRRVAGFPVQTPLCICMNRTVTGATGIEPAISGLTGQSYPFFSLYRYV